MWTRRRRCADLGRGDDILRRHAPVAIRRSLQPRGRHNQRPRPGQSEAVGVEVTEAAAVERVGVLEDDQFQAQALHLAVPRLVEAAELVFVAELETGRSPAALRRVPQNPLSRACSVPRVDPIVDPIHVVDGRRPPRLFAPYGVRPGQRIRQRVCPDEHRRRVRRAVNTVQVEAEPSLVRMVVLIRFGLGR